MQVNTIHWIDQLEERIQQNHMLLSPFYQAWTCGHLTSSQLKEYAKEYYHHVKAFPTYISAIHSRCQDQEVRRALLDNLIDEEAGHPNHPDLWRSFTLALGVTEEELNAHKPKQETQDLIHTFKDSCTSLPIAAGITALYCYESQIPPICKTKIEGLQKWYGLENPTDYRYFSVHETADVEHSAVEKKLLINLVKPEEEEIALKTGDKVLKSLNSFLDSFLDAPLLNY